MTYDDYHDVLTAFKNNYDAGLWLDSNGTLRFMCFSAGYDTILNEQRDDSLIYVDGTAEYTPPRGLPGLSAPHDSWWNEGLIYQDFLSQTAISTPDSSLVANGKIGVWATDCSTMSPMTLSVTRSTWPSRPSRCSTRDRPSSSIPPRTALARVRTSPQAAPILSWPAGGWTTCTPMKAIF